MNKKLYVMLLNNKRVLDEDVIKKHVYYLKELDEKGLLYLCGPFIDYGGGIVILKTDTLEEAIKIANTDPFISEGYRTFEIRTLEVVNKENAYGL